MTALDHECIQAKTIEAIKTRLDGLNIINAKFERLDERMDNIKDALSEIKDKLTLVERQPIKRWDTTITALISSVIGALVGFIASGGFGR